MGRIDQVGQSLDHFSTLRGRHASVLEDASIRQPETVTSPRAVRDGKLRHRDQFHDGRAETSYELGEVCVGARPSNVAVHLTNQGCASFEWQVPLLEAGNREV
jgi:hypothetical protein